MVVALIHDDFGGAWFCCRFWLSSSQLWCIKAIWRAYCFVFISQPASYNHFQISRLLLRHSYTCYNFLQLEKENGYVAMAVVWLTVLTLLPKLRIVAMLTDMQGLCHPNMAIIIWDKLIRMLVLTTFFLLALASYVGLEHPLPKCLASRQSSCLGQLTLHLK